MKLAREEWLKERQKSIGGSDAAALVGMNPYATPYMLWAEKTGRLPQKEDTEAMRQGRDLEAYVAKRFCEAAGKRARTYPELLKNPQYPFAHANIDRKVTGERAGLECKTTSVMNLKKFKNGEYPENYYAQCMHYLAVTGWEKWYLAVLILNQGFYWYTIERDENEIHALMETEKEFWEKHVLKDIPPEPDGELPTEIALESIYPQSFPGGTLDLFGREELIKDYLSTQELIASYKKDNERRKQILQQEMGTFEEGKTGRYAVMWKSQARSSFDVKAFSKEHPEIDLSPYYTFRSFRKFSIKERS